MALLVAWSLGSKSGNGALRLSVGSVDGSVLRFCLRRGLRGPERGISGVGHLSLPESRGEGERFGRGKGRVR